MTSTAKWDIPPKAKVYEALSAVADGRVTLGQECKAKVVSSSLDKSYDVSWSDDKRAFFSNDNASFWQGYLGYPIIAVLLSLKVIPFDESIAKALAGIPWKKLNTKFKRDYEKAVDHVLSNLQTASVAREDIEQEVQRIHEAIKCLELEKFGAGKKRPPI